jgi:hypothetical protein
MSLHMHRTEELDVAVTPRLLRPLECGISMEREHSVLTKDQAHGARRRVDDVPACTVR